MKSFRSSRQNYWENRNDGWMINIKDSTKAVHRSDKDDKICTMKGDRGLLGAFKKTLDMILSFQNLLLKKT
jgi:hypothetical protein